MIHRFSLSNRKEYICLTHLTEVMYAQISNTSFYVFFFHIIVQSSFSVQIDLPNIRVDSLCDPDNVSNFQGAVYNTNENQ